jgi:hypothetical protein
MIYLTAKSLESVKLFIRHFDFRTRIEKITKVQTREKGKRHELNWEDHQGGSKERSSSLDANGQLKASKRIMDINNARIVDEVNMKII